MTSIVSMNDLQATYAHVSSAVANANQIFDIKFGETTNFLGKQISAGYEAALPLMIEGYSNLTAFMSDAYDFTSEHAGIAYNFASEKAGIAYDFASEQAGNAYALLKEKAAEGSEAAMNFWDENGTTIKEYLYEGSKWAIKLALVAVVTYVAFQALKVVAFAVKTATIATYNFCAARVIDTINGIKTGWQMFIGIFGYRA